MRARIATVDLNDLEAQRRLAQELHLERARKYGKDPMVMAKRLFTHYRRGLYVDTGVGNEEYFQEKAAQFCRDFDLVLEKSSANIFLGTRFETLMRLRGVQTLIFTGIATEAGIETSARDAAARGFFPVVVSDGVSSMDQAAHERSLLSLAKAAIVTDMAAIQAAL